MKLKFLDRFSLRTKLWILAGSLMFIACALWGAGAWLENRISKQSQELVQTLEQLSKANETAREAQIQFKTQVQEWKNILVRGHDSAKRGKYRGQFEASEKEVDASLLRLKDLFQKLEIPIEAVDRVLKEHQALGQKYRAALDTWQESDPLAYRAVDGQLTGIDRPMNEAIGALATETDQQAKRIDTREMAEMAEVLRSGALLKGVLLLLGLGFGFFVAIAILERIQSSMHEVCIGLEHMVKGDFTQHIAVQTQDELGQMASDFNTLRDRFQEVFSQLGSASRQVAEDSSILSGTASEVARTSGEIARFTETQRLSSERTAAAMTEFAASIQEVVANVHTSHLRTEAVVKAAAEGAQQGTATVSAMKAIQEASEQMVRAVQVIQDLARQTNLLALNAAIEAAKAGQHGKGFAVVAEEVRKLAEHSSAAAKEIGDLIQQTELAMQEGTRTVEATEGTIQMIQDDIQAVAHASQEIGAASDEQGRTAQEVAKQVEEVAQATERGAAAATELSHTVEEVNRTAEHLARIAEDLSRTLGQFRT